MALDGAPSVDADVCREHLGTLLSEEIAALRELEDLLKREHEVLGAKNVAAIERTALVRAAPYAPCTATRPTGSGSRA